MEKNRIVVFNRITDNHLQNVEFFEDLLENHYKKFTYGYNIISSGDIIDTIDDIECECEDKQLTFLIKFEKKVTKDILVLVTAASEVVFGSQKFNANCEISGKTLTMVITKKK